MTRWLLLPFSILYRIIIFIRNTLFDLNIIKSTAFNIPVITVGNITVGGTGKTPHIEYLVSHLKDKYNLAVLSRGYLRKTKGFVEATRESDAFTIGDEPLQIKQKFPSVIVAVDEDRVHGIEKMLEWDNKPRLVLLDDAYQHRKVKAGLNIVLADFNRPIDKDWMLPMGRLREPMRNINRADIVIVTKCPDVYKPAFEANFRQRLKLQNHQSLFFTALAYGSLIPVFKVNEQKTNDHFLSGKHVLVVSGIAQPERLYGYLKSVGAILYKAEFPDHHSFTNNDIELIMNAFDKIEASDKLIVCTEKDSVRLKSIGVNDSFKQLPLFYIPVSIKFIDEKEQDFLKQINNFINSY
jgi:tetraacyldisaccharide 4'-kinase